MRVDFRKNTGKSFKYGGGRTWDVVKVDLTGENNTNLPYINLTHVGGHYEKGVDGIGRWRKTFTFSLHLRNRNRRVGLVKLLTAKFKTKLVSLWSHSKAVVFVMDSAPKMTEDFRALISPNVVPYVERWIPCISHLLNTVMKRSIATGNIQKSEIEKSWISPNQSCQHSSMHSLTMT